MARAPLLQLTGIGLTFGGNPLFGDVSAVIQPGDRLALVGRNGSGKSTLMKIMAGLAEPDRGERAVGPGKSVGYMAQEPAMTGCETLGDYAVQGLGPSELWRVEAAAEGLGFDPAIPVAAASGGERRWAALARLIAEAPDLMLFDEPTNHLDITAIEWLERHLAETRRAFVIISHDRAFLSALTRGTLWLDRGELRRQDKGFAHFEAWRDRVWGEEDLARHKLDRKIRAEARWAVEGISARRRRNQGRLGALKALRAERAAQIAREGTAALALDAGPRSGRRVIEARGIFHAFGERPILRDLSLRVMRGDRVAIVGPNGVGKTTLVNILTGRLAPDEGQVTLGAGVELAVFDQRREVLDDDATLWETLTGDREIGVSGGSDQVMVRGTPRHVVGYLRDFLFDEAQARGPVGALSGGERARLLLAMIMARPSNLLVLDEPTNDLDIETLDLLQDVLADYAGTVILVSHDRDFVDRVATVTVAMEGGGRVTVHAGGWSDYAATRTAPAVRPRKAAAPAVNKAPARGAPRPQRASGLSFTERHRFERLPAEIERLEAEIGRLEALLSDPDLYARAPAKFARATEALTDRTARLSAAEEEWLSLAAKAEETRD